MKISVSGIVGSGKSSVSRAIAEKLGIERFYVGGIMREIAKERGVTFQELMEISKVDREIDLELDRRQRALNERVGKFIVDSRLGFYFIPDSFKVFLKVDISEAARRICGDDRDEEKYNNIEDAVTGLNARIASEKMRYKQCYDIDFPCEEKFDLIIDTTDMGVGEVVDLILDSIPCVECD